MKLEITLPPEVDRYHNDIRRFVDAMVFKLRKNTSKGRWEGLSMQYILELLDKEVTELKGAVTERNTVEIILEAADVANFAMIACSIAMENGHEPDIQRTGHSPVIGTPVVDPASPSPPVSGGTPIQHRKAGGGDGETLVQSDRPSYAVRDQPVGSTPR